MLIGAHLDAQTMRRFRHFLSPRFSGLCCRFFRCHRTRGVCTKAKKFASFRTAERYSLNNDLYGPQSSSQPFVFQRKKKWSAMAKTSEMPSAHHTAPHPFHQKSAPKTARKTMYFTT